MTGNDGQDGFGWPKLPTRAEMAERMLTLRQRALLRAREGKSSRWEMGAVMALCWATGIDIDVMTRPKDGLAAMVKLPQRVTIERLDMPLFDDEPGPNGWRNGPMYLVEFPGDDRPGVETAYWSAFLTEREVEQLETALLAMLAGEALAKRDVNERAMRVVSAQEE